jgi:transcriptional antiterminator RfaH
MSRWYVAHTHPKLERTALDNLKRQGFLAYLPRYPKTRRHARRTEKIAAPLFPGYLFISMDVAATRWRAIRSTIGVRHLICQGDAPTPVPDGVVEDIQAREGADGLVAVRDPLPFKAGDAVQIAGGPLREHTGWFECLTDDHRVMVLLTLLGRQIRLPFAQELVRAYA